MHKGRRVNIPEVFVHAAVACCPGVGARSQQQVMAAIIDYSFICPRPELRSLEHKNLQNDVRMTMPTLQSKRL